MNLRIIPCLLALSISHMSGDLYASCSGCSRGQSIVSEGTVSAGVAGLNGLNGAAGLAGLQGVQGAPGTTGGQGVPGTTGSPGIAGGLIDYAFIYRADGAGGQQIIPDMLVNQVIFTNIGAIAPGSTFAFTTGSQTIAINSTGTYLARYKVIVALAHASNTSTFSLALNSQNLPGSDRSTNIGPGAASLTMVGETIFTVTTPGALLSVVNAGGSSNTAGPLTDIGADKTGVPNTAVTSATLFVQKIAN